VTFLGCMKPMASLHDREHVHVQTRAELRAWLLANGARAEGVWVVYPKGSQRTMTYQDLVKELLCAGWIDAVVGKVDDSHVKSWISPRRKGSGWSGVNKVFLKELEGEGLLLPSGIAAIERAKQDGSWELLDDVEAGVVPADLAKALQENGVSEVFAALAKSRQREWLLLLKTAKRPETRAARITRVIEACKES